MRSRKNERMQPDHVNDSALAETIHAKRWFYEFDLPDGSHTRSYLPAAVLPIHRTRLELLWAALDPIVQNHWNTFTALDVACHQGFFAIHLARKGCRSVTAVDARQQHVDDARLMGRAYGLQNLRVEQHNVTDGSCPDLGTFDIAVMFGLLYHVENPVGLLRWARRHTRRVCVVETQIGPSPGAAIDWGTHLVQRQVAGSFYVIDETGETDEPESGLTEISLCPSLDALIWIMTKVGFSRVEIVPAAPAHYEQHVSGARVVVAGFVDASSRSSIE
jgi:hypothetical protein